MTAWLRLLPFLSAGAGSGAVVHRFPDAGDRALLERLRADPHRGWRLFLDRYAQDLLSWIRQLGFDGDEAMERFVYVCETLAADRCRRLREVRRLGDRGELVPWLRTVVRNAVVSWHWSQHGRRRLPKAVAALGDDEQRVFQAHYWEGLGPAEIRERLESEGRDVDLFRVFDALETIFDVLSDDDRWRLASGLLSRQPEAPLDALADPPSRREDAQEAALREELQARVRHALVELPASDRLLLQLRYEEGCTYSEMASISGCDSATARRRTGRILERLRLDLEEGKTPS